LNESANNGSYAKLINEILSALPDVVIVFDTSGRISYANQKYADILKVRQADIIGKTPSELERTGNNHESIEAKIQDIVNNRKPQTIEGNIQLSGEHHRFEHEMVPLFREDGSVASVLMASRDVTEKHKAFNDINESRKQVLDVLESISDGFLALDSSRRITYINKQGQELLGIRGVDVLYRELTDIMPGAQAHNFISKLERAKEQNRTISFEEFSHCHGRWLEFHVYPYKHGTSVYFSDITACKQAEKTQKDTETQLRNLIKYANTAIYEIDIRGSRFISVNDAMCILTGYTREELLAMSPTNLLDDESKIRLKERIRKGLSGEDIDDTVEYKARAKDGRERHIVLHVSFIYEDGIAAGAFVVGHDVTEKNMPRKT
jgi:PAS domain S-box-containing protein